MWAVDVPCELCGAAPGDDCRTPADVPAQRPHRVRLVLSVVGLKSRRAAALVEGVLRAKVHGETGAVAEGEES